MKKNFFKELFCKKTKRIDSFDTVTLRISGMRYTNEYEILMKNGEAEVSFYDIRYTDAKDRRVLQKRASCKKEEVLDLLNGCGVLSWDGFHGAHPRGVKDGVMFRLSANVNGGESIYANGSQNFPHHYAELRDGLKKILENGEDIENV